MNVRQKRKRLATVGLGRSAVVGSSLLLHEVWMPFRVEVWSRRGLYIGGPRGHRLGPGGEVGAHAIMARGTLARERRFLLAWLKRRYSVRRRTVRRGLAGVRWHRSHSRVVGPRGTSRPTWALHRRSGTTRHRMRRIPCKWQQVHCNIYIPSPVPHLHCYTGK